MGLASPVFDFVEPCVYHSETVNVSSLGVSDDIPPHLKELYENSSKGLGDEEKLQLKALLMHYKIQY
jgi:hypothetical protein